MHLVVVDCNDLAHRARFSTGPLKYKEKATGVIFGFLEQLYVIGRELRPDDIIFVWDTQESKRRERHHFYKNRPPQEEDQETIESFAQFDELKEDILLKLGFLNVFWQSGYEADDIIARIIRSPKYKEHKFTLVSRDEDMYQLLDNCDIYHGFGKRKKNSPKFITRQWFINKYGITPAEWVKVKQIAGCSSDTVPGVDGVGETTAIKYLRNELNPLSKKYRDIKNAAEIISRNRWLVKLPIPGTKLPVFTPSSFSIEEFKKLCKDLGFFRVSKNFNKLNDWEAFYG